MSPAKQLTFGDHVARWAFVLPLLLTFVANYAFMSSRIASLEKGEDEREKQRATLITQRNREADQLQTRINLLEQRPCR